MRISIFLLIAMQLLVTACASGPVTVASSADPEIDGASGVSAERLPVNPYLLSRRSVSEDAQHSFVRAKTLLEQEDWPGAELELLALIEASPTLSGPCLDLALVYRQLGDSEQALLWFQRSIANNASNISAYNEYGIFLRELGRFAEAEVVYLQALEEWEASADSHRNIGILYDLYLGEPSKALKHYSRYQALSKDKNREMSGWIADLERRQQSAEEDARL